MVTCGCLSLGQIIKDLPDISFNCNVIEKIDMVTIRAEIPGLEILNINIEIQNSVLRIFGEKFAPNNNGEISQFEINYGKFDRSITLPEYIDEENVEASYNNGVLTIVVNKVNLPRKIKINIKQDSAHKDCKKLV